MTSTENPKGVTDKKICLPSLRDFMCTHHGFAYAKLTFIIIKNLRI